MSSSSGSCASSSLADDLVVALRVRGGQVHDVDQHARAGDVAQERVAQAGAAAGALDQAGHVRDGRAPLVGRVDGRQVEHAQVGA